MSETVVGSVVFGEPQASDNSLKVSYDTLAATPVFSLPVKFTKLDSFAITPTYAKPGDAGLDLVAITKEHKPPYIEYGTGIAVEIPQGYVGLIFPRSSITKSAPGVSLKNSVGVIDSGYRGEIMVRMEMPTDECVWDGYEYVSWNDGEGGPMTNGMSDILPTPGVGERIAQLIIIPYPTITLVEVDKLSDSERGSGGFGSTGV